MIEKNNHRRRLKTGETIFYLTVSILLNSLSNALAIVSKLGSAVWTASAVNVSVQCSTNLGDVLIIYAVIVQIINLLIRKKLNWHLIFSNLLFAFLFSYCVQFWTSLLWKTGLASLNFVFRLIIDIIGIGGIAAATSIYQRVNLMMHPNDEFSYLIRFKFVHGSATLGQYLSYIIPVVVMGLCFFKGGYLISIGWGTLFALFFQGPLTGIADKCIFPCLKHPILLKN